MSNDPDSSSPPVPRRRLRISPVSLLFATPLLAVAILDASRAVDDFEFGRAMGRLLSALFVAALFGYGAYWIFARSSRAFNVVFSATVVLVLIGTVSRL